MTASPMNPPSEPGTMPPWAKAADCATVDRYLLGPELGRGGMGRVHAAWDPMLKRVVALKLLLGPDPELHLRLLREARIQAKLDHPCICRIHDLGQAEGQPYIAMQLVPGRSLVDLRPELDFRAMALVMADVAGAIHAAHHAGLIHRDLKPANILVETRADGTLHPCVVDFGLARDLTLVD
jgi:eukaryotic-like serine/threonine-protein kinase